MDCCSQNTWSEGWCQGEVLGGELCQSGRRSYHPHPFGKLRAGTSPRIGVRGRLSPIKGEGTCWLVIVPTEVTQVHLGGIPSTNSLSSCYNAVIRLGGSSEQPEQDRSWRLGLPHQEGRLRPLSRKRRKYAAIFYLTNPVGYGRLGSESHYALETNLSSFISSTPY